MTEIINLPVMDTDKKGGGMKTENVTGREVEMTVEEVFEANKSLSRIMKKEFDEKSAYRLGKLQSKFISIIWQVDKDRLPIFEMFGKKDVQGNISIPQAGEMPVRVEGEAEDMFNQRLAEYDAVVKLNENFEKEMSEIFQKKVIINIPPVNLPNSFTITPADRMSLVWLLGDEEEILDTDKKVNNK